MIVRCLNGVSSPEPYSYEVIFGLQLFIVLWAETFVLVNGLCIKLNLVS